MSEKKNSLPSPARPGSMFGLLGIASTMGMHMVSGPLVGGGLGWLADRWLGSWPVGLGIGIMLGIAAGFRNVWADAKRLERGQAELDAAQAVERAARAESALKGEGRRNPSVPKRSLRPEEHLPEEHLPEERLPKKRLEETPSDEYGEHREQSGRPSASLLAGDNIDKAWEAYAELEHELKEENAAPDASLPPNDAPPNRKHDKDTEKIL